MKKIYYWIIGIITVLGIICIYQSIHLGPANKVKQEIPSHFQYQSESDKIPEEYLIIQNTLLSTDSIYQKDKYGNTFFCKPSENEAEKIEYFSSSSSDQKVSGGWYYRYAVICGEKYWIVDWNHAFGQKIYGPFEK